MEKENKEIQPEKLINKLWWLIFAIVVLLFCITIKNCIGEIKTAIVGNQIVAERQIVKK